MNEIQTYLEEDGLLHCAVCKEPVEAFYPKGSFLEMRKHHRQCACERQAYAEEVKYYKEKEHQEGSSGADSPFCICAGAPFWLFRHYAGNDM